MKRNVEQKQTAMKKILLSALFVMAMLCRLQAQNAETHATVHAGETALETLLTEEQKQSVTHLTVTGTLLDEDYAFLRGGLLEQLDTLDLRDAEIDTIPAGALGEMYLYLILPKMIECIGDYAFRGECEVTGNFPFCGSFYGFYSSKPTFKASDDNCKLMNIVDERNSSIYSKDGETLYFLRLGPGFVMNNLECRIKDGTRIIGASALRGEYIYLEENNIVLPESIDSIGDFAFSDIHPAIKTRSVMNREYQPGGSYNIGSIVCEAKEPPIFGKIGNGTFIGEYFYLYVPEESLEEYKKAEGWKRFLDIRSLNDLLCSVIQIPKEHRMEKHVSPENYVLSFFQKAEYIKLYDIQGRVLFTAPAAKNRMVINRQKITKPYAIARIVFADGTNETMKLIP